jgi:hypothetical protein
VDLHSAERDDYFLRLQLNVKLPGVDRAVALQLVEDAEHLCPYSKATRGNIAMLPSTCFSSDALLSSRHELSARPSRRAGSI